MASLHHKNATLGGTGCREQCWCGTQWPRKGEVGERLEEGARGWQISETRYHESGGVEMAATLDIRTWLLPALAQLATAAPGTEERAAPGWKAAMDRRHPGHNTA